MYAAATNRTKGVRSGSSVLRRIRIFVLSCSSVSETDQAIAGLGGGRRKGIESPLAAHGPPKSLATFLSLEGDPRQQRPNATAVPLAPASGSEYLSPGARKSFLSLLCGGPNRCWYENAWFYGHSL